MTIDEFVKATEAITKILSVCIWPIFFMILLLKFSPALQEFVYSLGEFSFKGGGFEATAKRKQEASTALVAASVARPDAATTIESAARNAREAVAVVSDTVNARVIRRASSATVLWVDDKPSNNIFERQSLEALGISFTLATSTEEALSLVQKRSFDVIISDMGRPPDSRAGYTLLDKLRSSGNQTPFIIYAGSNAPEHKSEASSHGAFGSTNRAIELFEYVLSTLNGKR